MYGYGKYLGGMDALLAREVGGALLSDAEVRGLLGRLPGVFKLVAALVYTTGAQVEELLQLRVRDVKPGGRLAMPGREGHQPRTLQVPEAVERLLQGHLERLLRWHEGELERGGPVVEIPVEEQARYPQAGRRWCWQYLFPSARAERVAEGWIRKPLAVAAVQRVLADAGKELGLERLVHAQGLRHAFAAGILAAGGSEEELRGILGHANEATTRRYADLVRAASRCRRELPAATVRPQPAADAWIAHSQPALPGLQLAMA